MSKKGFTLAEVLVTLGVIGVVSAITMPILIQNHQKHVTENKLKHFYSMINQALKMGTLENGEVEEQLGNLGYNFTYDENEKFLEKYILPYIKYLDIKPCKSEKSPACVHLANGELFMFNIDKNGGDVLYFPNGKYTKENERRNRFAFQFYKKSGEITYSKNLIEPYTQS